MPLYKGYVRERRHKEGETVTDGRYTDCVCSSSCPPPYLRVLVPDIKLGLGNQNNTKRPKLLSDLRTLSKHSVKNYGFGLKGFFVLNLCLWVRHSGIPCSKLLIIALSRQKQVDLWVWSQHGLQSLFQDSQVYSGKPCLKKPKQKHLWLWKEKTSVQRGKPIWSSNMDDHTKYGNMNISVCECYYIAQE